MAITILKYLFSILGLCIALSAPVTSQVTVADLLKHRLFIFGDSLFDPGNSFYLNGDNPAVHLPYGMTLNNPTGRYSDGYLVPDYIGTIVCEHECNASLPKTGCQFLRRANFACAGAGALQIRVGTLNLKEQLENFMKVAAAYVQQYGQRTSTTLLNRSVFLFSLGGADYFQLFADTPNPTASQKVDFVNWVVGNLSSALTDIYNVGGRRIAFQNVAPLGCAPGSKQGQQIGHDVCYEPYNEIATLHNSALLKALATMRTQLPGFAYVVYDYYNTLKDRIQNPTNYGFQVGDIACCGSGSNRGASCGTNAYELCSDPNQYVYFDGVHTGQNANYQLAQLLWNGGSNVTTPYNMKNYFGLL